MPPGQLIAEMCRTRLGGDGGIRGVLKALYVSTGTSIVEMFSISFFSALAPSRMMASP